MQNHNIGKIAYIDFQKKLSIINLQSKDGLLPLITSVSINKDKSAITFEGKLASFSLLLQPGYHDYHTLIILLDSTTEISEKEIDSLIGQHPHRNTMPIILVVDKAALSAERKISESAINEFRAKYNIKKYYELDFENPKEIAELAHDCLEEANKFLKNNPAPIQFNPVKTKPHVPLFRYFLIGALVTFGIGIGVATFWGVTAAIVSLGGIGLLLKKLGVFNGDKDEGVADTITIQHGTHYMLARRGVNGINTSNQADYGLMATTSKGQSATLPRHYKAAPANQDTLNISARSKPNTSTYSRI